ncbi:hypothetical protein K488DRAFT_40918 [Vararia minispora EC-137]|uniref:Uncharacterized protein n=1 Tax=Vararia minispora EC-137 TaxID=1314806 RepID=A0ACB8QYC6_9AGAM|nr:hypothetical protein K488DRAFT_40918 [Vararia minispora EC-137]
MTIEFEGKKLTPETVPIGEGPPTREQLLVHYPASFTWHQLKTFVNSGDLGLLKRDKRLQRRYMAWSKVVTAEYGSVANYLLNYRLQWGRPDTRSILKSRLDLPADPRSFPALPSSRTQPKQSLVPTVPPGAPSYFTADISPELISIISNDWPYSIPAHIEHTLIWTVVDIIPPNVPESIKPRLYQDGLWGFTGYSNDSPPPSPSKLSNCLPALAEWGVTEDKMIRSAKGTPEEEQAVIEAGGEIQTFIVRRWNEREWETAWFVNPPRLQSIPSLAHIHVFARCKDQTEQEGWNLEHA